ncbi:hypothetical protein GOP47_0002203 [Adiantum capillus-veneris]|uniref:Uncharacterized protein n=1 Tax=Adiantum capillus-veneris TaxID=13818 RepID=A0A9D4V8B2_ADICA|nr:hypothetical protein GOP47_0001464 [Adiantum capillus-veneris]KAI5082460.1 hypothetical protein GOP47_0002203 [Adiantum capillus-veneris]
MGCSASTLDTEQSVTRCKNRKHFIKLAVRHRHAFAAAHAAYIQSLKNTGAAIRQFGEGEAKETQIAEAPSNIPDPLYLPPPLPHFLASSPHGQPSPITRAASMPPLRAPPLTNTSPAQTSPLGRSPTSNSKSSPVRHTGLSPVRSSSLSPHGPLQEEGEEEEEVGDEEVLQKKMYDITDAKPPPPPPLVTATPPPPPPPKGSPWDYLEFPSTTGIDDLGNKTGALKVEEMPNPELLHEETLAQETDLQENHEELSVASKEGPPQSPQVSAKLSSSGKDLSHILRELDDQFLSAFESGKLVAKLLEARKMHYHSNLADTTESLDHSMRVLRVMSWDRNPQLPLTNGETIDFFHSKEKETHASTLDKLLAWEKKLHDEVKAGELIRMELERRSSQLRSQKKREENAVAVDKTKAVVKSLQTRYLVEIQAVDAAASEIDKLRDDCLHNQLVDLVKELMAMWDCMLQCHQQQHRVIEEMGSPDNSYAPVATHDFHYKNTLQLESEINLLHQHLDKLISTQKEYLNSVYHWLRLHIIQIESDGKDTPGSPQKMSTPPVYNLCRAWLCELDRLPGNVTLHSLKAFSSLIHELTLQQSEELKQKKKLESLRKELDKKEQSFKAQEAKYNGRRSAQQPPVDSQEDAGLESGNPYKERERLLQLLRDTVEVEREKYEHMCSKSGSMALSILEKGLPPVLNAVTDFANACSRCYKQLHYRSMQPTLQINYE